MNKTTQYLLCCSLWLLISSHTVAIDTVAPAGLRDQGEALYREGRFEHALRLWQQAFDSLPMQQEPKDLPPDTTEQAIGLLRHIAQVSLALGLNDRALSALQQAQSLAAATESSQYSRVLSELGDWYLGNGQWQQAGETLSESVSQARALRHPGTLAAALNNLGNALVLAAAYDQAQTAYEESLHWAVEADNRPLQTTVLINLTRLQLQNGQLWQTAYSALGRALGHVRQRATPAQVADLMTLTRLTKRLMEGLGGDGGKGKALSRLHRTLLEQALEIATDFYDPHQQAYAHGYLGQYYEDRQDYPQAMHHTRQAIFFAEQARYPANLYLWQWQRGRLLKAQGYKVDAVAAYRQAVVTLNPVRSHLMNNYRAPDVFYERIQPVYFGLADLLLEQAQQLTTPPKTGQPSSEDLLREARDSVEILNTAELQDYFQDECTVALQTKQTGLDGIDPHTAVIYPVILPQRLVLLVSLNGQLQQVVVPVTATRLELSTRRFRRHLQIRSRHAYLVEARQLYDWMIRPLQAQLSQAEIHTLVFVPSGVLRTIPLTALQDGQQFLVEQYALATTPSLSLTDPQPLSREDTETLITSLSKSVQGFPALPGVAGELSTVQDLLGGKILQDKDYSVDSLSGALKETEYSVLHMATHGVFGGSAEQSFLLTYDDKLNMNRLGELLQVGIFRDKPLELLTLSACQTTLGDERSALGLAGVAVQFGARSAVASLWFVDDAATAAMMAEFYQQLARTDQSKARALQQAQLSLLQQPQYRHPIYWASPV
ncbi:hypothetical protein AB835_03790 [Candidatus Endobugula sertula]|uniref:CHAT domain-containing protein n=1 Tax=Candidatus Endobugula sertula TaxID=62101 RepID=A0A1D2QSD7_9GAMM|nr:hypothetical protein AB835_03790 [Candidatus Endobugula sertula]